MSERVPFISKTNDFFMKIYKASRHQKVSVINIHCDEVCIFLFSFIRSPRKWYDKVHDFNESQILHFCQLKNLKQMQTVKARYSFEGYVSHNVNGGTIAISERCGASCSFEQRLQVFSLLAKRVSLTIT